MQSTAEPHREVQYNVTIQFRFLAPRREMDFSPHIQPFKHQNDRCVLRGRSLRFGFLIFCIIVRGSWILMSDSSFLTTPNNLQRPERPLPDTSSLLSKISGTERTTISPTATFEHQLQSENQSGTSSSTVDLTAQTAFQHGAITNQSVSSSPLAPTISASLTMIPSHWNLCTTEQDVISGVKFIRLYQCLGPRYEAFGKALISMVNRQKMVQHQNYTNKQVNEYPSNTWGQRPLPVSRPNSTILMIGNSHLRQIAMQLIGQYASRYSSSQIAARMLKPPSECLLHNNLTLNGRPALACGHYSKITFLENNSTLIFIVNTPIVYSQNWLDRLLQWLPSDFAWSDSTTSPRTKSSSLDAIVWGKFNTHSEDSHTNFGKAMTQLSSVIPCVDFQKYPPPQIGKIAASYDGPILAVSMFARAYINEYNRQTKLDVANLNRSNVVYMDARRYMDELGDCGSVGQTVNIETVASTKCVDGLKAHTCTGKYGSHADLIAWDIIEELHRLVPT